MPGQPRHCVYEHHGNQWRNIQVEVVQALRMPCSLRVLNVLDYFTRFGFGGSHGSPITVSITSRIRAVICFGMKPCATAFVHGLHRRTTLLALLRRTACLPGVPTYRVNVYAASSLQPPAAHRWAPRLNLSICGPLRPDYGTTLRPLLWNHMS